MPGTVNLSTMVTRVRRRADMENTDFVSDAEIEEYVEASFGELVDLLIMYSGDATWMSTVTGGQSTVAGTETYSIYTNDVDMIDADVYKVLGVEVKFDGKWRRIGNFKHWQNSWLEDQSGWSGPGSVKYKVQWQTTLGSEATITFEPAPSAVHEFRVLYIPYPADWSTGGFTNFLGYTGWEEYIIVDAAMKCLEKEESDVSHLARRMEIQRDRLTHHAQSMNMGEGSIIRDIYGGVIYDEDHLRWRLP